MGLRPKKLPVEANDSNGLEAKNIAGQGQGKQRARIQQNQQLESMTAMGPKLARLMLDVNNGNVLKVGKIDA